MFQTHTVYARDIPAGSYFRRPGCHTVYLRLTPNTIRSLLKVASAPKKVFGVSQTGNIAKFDMEASVVQSNVNEFVGAVQGCAVGTGCREKNLPNIKECETNLDTFIALEMPDNSEASKRFRLGLEAVLEEHREQVTRENAKERDKLAGELTLARAELKELLPWVANVYDRKIVTWAEAVELLKHTALDKLNENDLRPGPGTKLKAKEIWVGGYFKTCMGDEFFVRRKPPVGHVVNSGTIYSITPSGREAYVGREVDVCVITEEEFESHRTLKVGDLVMAADIPIGEYFWIENNPGDVYKREHYPWGKASTATCIAAVDAIGRQKKVAAVASVRVATAAQFHRFEYPSVPKAASFSPKVRDVYRVPGHNGRYHVYKVNAVNLGGENQEGVVELETVDRKPNPTDKPLIVPVCILSALDPEPVN